MVRTAWLGILAGTGLVLAGCVAVPIAPPSLTLDRALHPLRDDGPPAPFDNIDYATWNPAEEPAYRLYPGDEVDMRTPYAPDLDKQAVIVGPDGRGNFPMIGGVMLAQRSLDDIKAELQSKYATQLRRPVVELSVKAAPMKVFVGGEVTNPGAYDMIGDADSLRAIMQAGGFKTTANTKSVVIIRRGRDGTAMMRTANMDEAFHHGLQPDLVPLRRDDVIFVPRSGIANIGLFMQQYFRDALPISFSYALGSNAYVSR